MLLCGFGCIISGGNIDFSTCLLEYITPMIAMRVEKMVTVVQLNLVQVYGNLALDSLLTKERWEKVSLGEEVYELY